MKNYDFLLLFDRFLKDSQSGKRLQKNGARISSLTLEHYVSVFNELRKFTLSSGFSLRVKNMLHATARQLHSEKIYWKRFYKKYTEYIFACGGYDNYAGSHFRVIRTFFGYLNNDLEIISVNVFDIFYIRNEHIPVIALNKQQLQFLIYNVEFESILPAYLKRTKDIFVFGCTTGLRFIDIMHLCKNNIQKIDSGVYLTVRSKKTKTDTRVKLPDYIVEILAKYKGQKHLLPILSNARLNLNLKELCEKAGWTYAVGKQRERSGVVKTIFKDGKTYRFCDLVTTHTMRKTAITTLLTLGMPELLVRKISGHSPNSKEFYRYVNFAQLYIDNGIDKIYDQMKLGKAENEICK